MYVLNVFPEPLVICHPKRRRPVDTTNKKRATRFVGADILRSFIFIAQFFGQFQIEKKTTDKLVTVLCLSVLIFSYRIKQYRHSLL